MNSTQCDITANQPVLASFIHAGRSAVENGSLHERKDPTRPKDTLIYPDTDVAQWASWQFGNVSDFMKITAEVNGPSTQQQTEIVRLTHSQYQKQTMTYASETAAYDQAVDSMTDGIQHVPDDGIIDAATIQKILEQGQFATPTLNVFEYAYRDPVLQQYFDVQPGSNRTLDDAQTNAQLLYEAGVPLIAGTDSVGSLDMTGTTVSVPFDLTLH
ncbi:putative Amidohydrolase-related domain-containing protein [Seiridium cardinale]